MGAVLALSAWLGFEALHGGPSIAGRVLDAQTGDPVARAAIVVDGRTAAAAGADGVFSAPAGSTRRVDVLVTAVGYTFVTRHVDVTAGTAPISVTFGSTASPPASPNASRSAAARLSTPRRLARSRKWICRRCRW